MTQRDAVRMLDDVRPDETVKEYLPGMGRRWLLPLYDPMTRAIGQRRVLRAAVAATGVEGGDAVLDIGCGTGNLTLAVLRAAPGAVVTGLDPDADALRVAARKARRRRTGVTLVRGYADRLPVPDSSQDHVVSSLALHHVPLAEKQKMAAEVVRVLRTGGTVTIADLVGEPRRRGGGRRAHGGHGRSAATAHVEDNADGGIERLLSDVGLVDVREVDRTTLLGMPVAVVQARR